MASINKLCRLCLKRATIHFEPLGSSKLGMLKKISLDIDPALIDTPVICSKCLNVLQQSFDFKTTCLNNNDYLRTFLNSTSDKLTLDEIVQKNATQHEIKCEEELICRFCLKYSDHSNFVKLNVEDDIFLKDMLQKCLQEIDLGITDRPLICNDCMENLQNQFNFVMSCLDVEERIKKYAQASGNGQVEIIDVLKNETAEAYPNFIKVESVDVDGTSCDVIKKEEIEDVVTKPEAVKSDRRYLCQHCSFQTKYKNCITNHIKIIHEKATAKLYRCQKCDFRTYQKSSLSKHLKKYSASAPFKCERCSKTFLQKVQMYGHILKNHNDMHHLIKSRIYLCDACSYKTLNSTDLTRHKHQKHSVSIVHKYQCDQCEYSCLEKSGLRTHAYTHTNDKPIRCSDCGKGFTRKRQLDAHILHHHAGNAELEKVITHEIIYCGVCSYSTIGSYNLRMHMKVHG